jgi:acyl-CoA thioester hydrolase
MPALKRAPLAKDTVAKNAAGRTHRLALRVYYEDTDAAGIVYYANYLKFAERARSELLRELGAGPAAIAATDGVAFAVRGCTVEYLKPARLDDLIEVETGLTGLGGASLEALQTVRRDGVVLTEIRVRLACLDNAGRARRLPRHLRVALTPYLIP